MNEELTLIEDDLIPIYQNPHGDKVVVVRELYKFLDSKQDFSDWIKNRIEKFGFKEGEDFSIRLGKSTGGRPSIEYRATLDMAKELSMVESTERGSQARKYFIDIEKRYKQQQINTSLLSPELQMFKQLWDGLALSQIKQAATDREVKEVKDTLNVIQDTIVSRDDDWRKSTNSMINTAAFRSGKNYNDLRSESYRLLEERGHCDLNKRLRNMKSRLSDNGATKSKIEALSKMDVIESDSRLKEIYTAIVKEISIRSLKVAR